MLQAKNRQQREKKEAAQTASFPYEHASLTQCQTDSLLNGSISGSIGKG